MSNDPGLGLPPTAGAATGDAMRPHIAYTIPEACLGSSWNTSQFTDDDRTFRLIELTPAHQERAAKIANGNAAVMGREMMFFALWRIGGWAPQRDRTKLNDWWTTIGPKGRRLVEAAFLRMQSVEEADIESFLDTGKPG